MLGRSYQAVLANLRATRPVDDGPALPAFTDKQLRNFVDILMRLRGETMGKITQATGIRPANLSVWLHGKEQVISAKRLVALLRHLGVEGGRLRTDMLHQWQDHGALGDTKIVLETLWGDKEPIWLFKELYPELIHTHFLLAGELLICINIEPGINRAHNLEDVIKVERIITTHYSLNLPSKKTLQSARDELLKYAKEAATTMDDVALVDGLMQRLKETTSSNVSSPAEWEKLEQALRDAFMAGAGAGEIAKVIDENFDFILIPLSQQ